MKLLKDRTSVKRRLDYILLGHAPDGRESTAFEDQALAQGAKPRYFVKKQNELKHTVLSFVQL